MGTTTQQIEDHIEHTREALGSNLDELQRKVNAATDWRHHFRTKPEILLGIAFGGGLLMSAALGGRRKRTEKRRFPQSNAGAGLVADTASREQAIARQTWNNVKGAIVAVATTRLLNYAGEAFLGFPAKSEQIDKTSRVISPRGE